jgi:AcrR family transcriptional regulator
MSRNERAGSREKPLQKNQGKQGRKPDERARRTHARLGSALLGLIQEKPIGDVTLRELLARAAVGRSTFYLHFRDKNDLLLCQLENFLEIMSTTLSVCKEDSHRVLPVAEMFAHIAGQTKLYRSLADSGHLTIFFDLAQGHFGRGIEQRLRESARPAKIPPRELAACAAALAGSLVSLLRWWLDRGAKEPPSDMDRLFHRIVWNGLR